MIKTLLIILGIIIAVAGLISFVNLYRLGRFALMSTRNAAWLIEPDGWAGFLLDDPYKFVLSRLKHLRLIDKKGVKKAIEEYSMLGPAVGIHVATDRFDNVKSLSFRFTPFNSLESISIIFKQECLSYEIFNKNREDLIALLGAPTFEKYEQRSHFCKWDRVVLDLLDDGPKYGYMYILVSNQ